MSDFDGNKGTTLDVSVKLKTDGTIIDSSTNRVNQGSGSTKADLSITYQRQLKNEETVGITLLQPHSLVPTDIDGQQQFTIVQDDLQASVFAISEFNDIFLIFSN